MGRSTWQRVVIGLAVAAWLAAGAPAGRGRADEPPAPADGPQRLVVFESFMRSA
jgi:hypothetical protein